MLTTQTILFLAGIGFLAGFIDSIAGGGGLITIPALLTVGIPPHLAIGTSKFSATFGSAKASHAFIKRKIIKPRLWAHAIIFTALFAVIGVIANHFIPADFLKKFLPFLIIMVAIYVGIYKPDKNREPGQFVNFEPPKFSSGIMGSILGFYDACFGPGTGSFWTCAVMAIYKMDLLTASGVARFMNFISNIAGLCAFILARSVNYKVGVVMGLGLLIGSYFGANSAIRFGAKFIRPIFLIVVISIAGRMLWQVI